MKIRMLKTAAGPNGVKLINCIYEVSEVEGKEMITANSAVIAEAEIIEEEKKEPETASMKQPETTAGFENKKAFKIKHKKRK